MTRSSFRKDEGGIQALGSHAGNHDVVHEAIERLGQYAHFRMYASSLSLDFRAGTLVVTGTLPSFYLKQVLQTILRDLPGVLRIDNRVEVALSQNSGNTNSSPSRNSDNERSV
jgi:hypothetical protein